MKINGTILNNFQSNFVKELMGDVYMTDVRAESAFLKLCSKYDVDASSVLESINKNFAVKNAALKKFQAEELSLVKE